jgi:hypothetical protein
MNTATATMMMTIILSSFRLGAGEASEGNLPSAANSTLVGKAAVAVIVMASDKLFVVKHFDLQVNHRIS